MLIKVVVPEVSDGVTSGTVIALSVAVGDQVEEDQTLIELETDKAVVAIPAPVQGRVAEVMVAEGDLVEVGAQIVSLDSAENSLPEEADPAEEAAEEQSQPTAEGPERTEETAAAVSIPVAAVDAPLNAEMQLPPPDLTPVRRGDKVAPAAPSVRRFARELGADINLISGSGPAGRVSEDDVRLYVRSVMDQSRAPQQVGGGDAVQRPLPDFSRWGSIRREPMSKVRELTAESMAYAWSSVPMVTQYDKAVLGRLEQFRQDHNRKLDAQDKLTMTAILLKICAEALKQFPQFNSSLDMESRELIYKDYIHIGVAVDTPNGLLVPVVREVDTKGISTLATELNDMAARTRTRRISPTELEGGTFTISNLGGIGGTSFTPLVYAPQVAILGVSRAVQEPLWDGQQFLPELTMPLSLTYDHRVIDGADGARFLRWICDAIENPITLAL